MKIVEEHDSNPSSREFLYANQMMRQARRASHAPVPLARSDSLGVSRLI
jgi:hypothetical protein